jgi:hypothetical protein
VSRFPSLLIIAVFLLFCRCHLLWQYNKANTGYLQSYFIWLEAPFPRSGRLH